MILPKHETRSAMLAATTIEMLEEEREKLKDCVLHLLFPERKTKDEIKNEISKIHREQLQCR
jgi:hypothetical protein